MAESSKEFDVAIIGGGPGGSTAGALLKKYNPGLRVLILEREKFPREHVGESQLPVIGAVLHEMGAWNKIEAAGFPIKIGATYTWGKTTDPWVFAFVPIDQIPEETRPGVYQSWRSRVAFQVDRAAYDDILLRHAADLGCEVRQGTRVTGVHHASGRVESLELEGGQRITATHYVDASGNAAILRRSLGVEVTVPTSLKNVAFWDYWSSPGLNKPVWEKEVTRVHIRSLPHGWVWFIALSMDRSSVGLVVPGDYYKAQGKRPEALYHESLRSDPLVVRLLSDGKPEGPVRSTTDWSFIAEQTYGPNWFLCGECLGFADPILAAGLTLTHTCARHCAYTILELERGGIDGSWLKQQYHETQRKRVIQHMRFAEYWYAGNGCFTDIHENCAKIAKDAGLRLDPAAAFRWLSTGGIDDLPGQVAIGGLDLAGLKQVQQRLTHTTSSTAGFKYAIDGKNKFVLNLRGAEKATAAVLQEGRIVRAEAYRRGPNTLVLDGGYRQVHDALMQSSDVAQIMKIIGNSHGETQLKAAMQCLEVMASNYWVTCSVKKGRPVMNISSPEEGEQIFTQRLGPRSRQGQRAVPAGGIAPGES